MKKTLSILLILVMVLAVGFCFTGCGGGEEAVEEPPVEEQAEGGITQEQVDTLTALGQEMVIVYNNYAGVYEQLDENTQALADDLLLTIDDINGILDGSITVADMDQVISGVQTQLEGAQNGWAEIEAQM